MDQPQLDPYLFFHNNCSEAMEFYRSIFGGKLDLSTYGQGPADAHEEAKANAAAMKDKIMHAKLEGEVSLMGADSPLPPDTLGTGKITLSISGTDEEKLRGWFEKLGAGGKVPNPLKKEFWGDTLRHAHRPVRRELDGEHFCQEVEQRRWRKIT
jgi:PhnB protein